MLIQACLARVPRAQGVERRAFKLRLLQMWYEIVGQARAPELTVEKQNGVYGQFRKFCYSRTVPIARAEQSSTFLVLELRQGALPSRYHSKGAEKCNFRQSPDKS